jgi:DNA-binding transcriptional MerR regulator
MPYKAKAIEKLYFTIGDVAKRFGVATSLIRYWEQEFENIRPKKNSKGNRKYTKDDIKEIETVYHLVKEKGYTLQGAREMIESKRNVVDNQKDILDSLNKVKSFLLELKQEL